MKKTKKSQTQYKKKKHVDTFIKSLSPHKAPGITGINSVFYTIFWVKIRHLVTNAVNSILEKHKEAAK